MNTIKLSTVSIILPVLNEAKYIGKCIRSLINNTYSPAKVEILVIDGGSDDGTREIVTKLSYEDQRVKLIDNPKRILSAGINIGINTANGDVLIRMDGHAEAAEDFIANSVEVLNENPDALCVGGAITSVNESYIGKVIASAMSCPLGVGNARFRLGDYEGYADTVAFGAYRKEVFERIGLLDENMLRTEDDDLHFRMHQAGGKIYISKRIHSKYYPRSSVVKLWRQYFQYGFWRIPTVLKHGQPATLRQVVPLSFVFCWIIFLIGSVLWSPIIYGLACYAAMYLAVLLAGAVLAIKKDGLVVGILTPVIFPILHFSYGLGSLAGVWKFAIMRARPGELAQRAQISR